MTLGITIVLAACLGAALTDVMSRRIPNWLTVPLALAGLVLNSIQGWRALLLCLAIMAAILIAGTAVHALGAIGGGDVKLVAAAAGMLNYPDALAFVLYVCMAGGVLALITSALHGRLLRTLRSTVVMGASLVAGASSPTPASDIKVPYGAAIFCGAALVALSHSLVPSLRLLP